MKRLVLSLTLAILLSLVLVTPVLAEDGKVISLKEDLEEVESK